MLRSRAACCLLLCSLVLVTAGDARASTLDLIEALRRVAVSATSICPGCGPMGEDEVFSESKMEESSDFGRFMESLDAVGSGASQDSDITAHAIAGSGGTSLGFSAESAGESLLRAVFEVTAASDWTLAGVLSGDEPVSLTLSVDGVDFFVVDHFGDPDTIFSQVLGLLPGRTYELEALTSSSNTGGQPSGGSWSFTFVPEPGSLSLLALGLAGLVGRRRAAG